MNSQDSGAGFVLLVIFFAIGVVVLYFIPAIVTFKRNHAHCIPILIVDLIFGATVLGWVGSLVWALITPRSADFALPVRMHDSRTSQAPPRATLTPPPFQSPTASTSRFHWLRTAHSSSCTA
jgi:hypothetical protein